MKNQILFHIKNRLLIFSLCITSICIVTTILPEKAPTPSVADVFGGMNEAEIAKQVQLGQQFLDDLEKFGTPEEKAQFEQMLMDTLNSMSEQDFNDITNIAKMVEPHLEPPLVELQAPTPTTSTAAETKPVVQVAQDETETFKTMISTIIQRIDDILQKLNSSKECSEELDVRWKSRATFGNLKRQIYVLRNDRLAQKLSKKDLSDDDKKLVETLKEFLKELTKQNDALVIEDSFGLPSNKETEAKHLAQAKTILSMFDDYIDFLMPKLEKFLTKHDPEALQMAKEAEEKTKTALKNAQDATVRKASADARPTPPIAPYNTTQGTGRPGFEYYGYGGDYYDENGQPYSSSRPQDFEQTPSSGGSAQPKDAKAQPTIAKEIDQKAKEVKNTFDNIVGEFQDHLATFDNKYEQKFTAFLTKIGTDYPATSRANQTDQPTGGDMQDADANVWLSNQFKPYVENIFNTLRNDFSDEFKSVDDLYNSANKSLSDLDAETTKKISSLPELATLEQRFNNYKDILEKTKATVEAKYKDIAANGALPTSPSKITDATILKEYNDRHAAFVLKLHTDLEKEIMNALKQLDLIKRKTRRKRTTA